MSLPAWLVGVAALALAAGCGGGIGTPVLVSDDYAQTLRLDESNIVVPEGGTFQLSAVGFNRKGEQVEVVPEWSVAPGGTGAGAVESASGLFTAQSKGVVKVRARHRGVEAVFDLKVSKPFESVKAFPVTPPVYRVEAGSEFQVSAMVIDEDGDEYRIFPTWTMVGYVGRVDEAGRVSVNASGRAKLLGSYPNVRAVIRVFFDVYSTDLASIAIIPIRPVVYPLDKVRIQVVGFDMYGNFVEVKPEFMTEGYIGHVDEQGVWHAAWPARGRIIARVQGFEASMDVAISPRR